MQFTHYVEEALITLFISRKNESQHWEADDERRDVGKRKKNYAATEAVSHYGRTNKAVYVASVGHVVNAQKNVFFSSLNISFLSHNVYWIAWASSKIRQPATAFFFPRAFNAAS